MSKVQVKRTNYLTPFLLGRACAFEYVVCKLFGFEEE